MSTYKGGTFRDQLRQYSKDRAQVDPVYKRDLDKAMALKRKARLSVKQVADGGSGR